MIFITFSIAEVLRLMGFGSSRGLHSIFREPLNKSTKQ